LKYSIYGTSYLEREWEERPHIDTGDWGEGKSAWIAGYRDSIHHPHRQFLVDTISRYAPFDTVLEIGSNCGPNLYLLSKKFPESKFYGVDINKEAIDFGNLWFKTEHISNVELVQGFADDLSRFAEKSIDVVFTDAVLIYIGPDKITSLLNEIFRITRKSVVFMEWHDFYRRREQDQFDGAHWVRNYQNHLNQYALQKDIKITKLVDSVWQDSNWIKYGAIIEVVLS